MCIKIVNIGVGVGYQNQFLYLHNRIVFTTIIFWLNEKPNFLY